MTTTAAPATAEMPSVRELPALYQMLRTLIPDPHAFFDNLTGIEEEPGKMTVTPRHTARPAITLTQLPNPLAAALAATEGQEPTEPPPGPLQLTMAHEQGAATATIRETLEREFDSAMLQVASQMLQEEAGAGRMAEDDARLWDEPGNDHTVMAAIKCVFYTTTDTGTIDEHVEELYRDVREAMQAMLSRPVLDMLAATCPLTGHGAEEESGPDHITIQGTALTTRQYNKGTLVMACSPECTGANAGALPWILAQPDPGAAPRHQGEFIGAERAAAMAQGLSARSWTAMTKMKPDITCRVISHCTGLAEAAGIINWLTGITNTPDEMSLSEILARPALRQRLSQPADTLADRNLSRAAALAVRRKTGPRTRGERAERHEVADALTYADAATMEGTEVTATTFGGLLKAVKRWHTRLNRDLIRQQWQAAVNANGGTVQSWQAALEQFEHEGVTATELTSEHMLLEEALELDHCVHLYGARSAGGTVRVFALRGAGGNRATTAIINANGTWRVEQTRARANHPAPGEMQACAQEIAKVCNGERAEDGENPPGTAGR